MGRNATLNAPSEMIVFENVSASALQFLVVPCLANALQANNCVSFKAFERPDSYLRLDNDVAHLSTFDKDDDNYNLSASFRIEGSLKSNGKLQRVSTVSIEALSKPSHYLEITADRELRSHRPNSSGGSMPSAAVFTFTANWQLPCIEGTPPSQNDDSMWCKFSV